jgi:hypothetical protein
MKYVLTLLGCFLIASLVYSIPQIAVGYGKKVTATGTPEEITLLAGADAAYAGSVSLYNGGSNEFYCAMNCSTAEFTTLLATTNAICVPGNMTYTFTKIAPRQITNVVVGTLGPSTTVYIAAY